MFYFSEIRQLCLKRTSDQVRFLNGVPLTKWLKLLFHFSSFQPFYFSSFSACADSGSEGENSVRSVQTKITRSISTQRHPNVTVIPSVRVQENQPNSVLKDSDECCVISRAISIPPAAFIPSTIHPTVFSGEQTESEVPGPDFSSFMPEFLRTHPVPVPSSVSMGEMNSNISPFDSCVFQHYSHAHKHLNLLSQNHTQAPYMYGFSGALDSVPLSSFNMAGIDQCPPATMAQYDPMNESMNGWKKSSSFELTDERTGNFESFYTPNNTGVNHRVPFDESAGSDESSGDECSSRSSTATSQNVDGSDGSTRVPNCQSIKSNVFETHESSLDPVNLQYVNSKMYPDTVFVQTTSGVCGQSEQTNGFTRPESVGVLYGTTDLSSTSQQMNVQRPRQTNPLDQCHVSQYRPLDPWFVEPYGPSHSSVVGEEQTSNIPVLLYPH